MQYLEIMICGTNIIEKQKIKEDLLNLYRGEYYIKVYNMSILAEEYIHNTAKIKEMIIRL